MHITVHAPAKINLGLAIGPLRDDGYHDVATVYHAITLYDTIVVRDAAAPELTVTSHVTGAIPTDGDNLVLRAVHALADAAGVQPRAAVELTKRIPVAAGLAGGSADAAAALVACNQLWQAGFSIAQLSDIAAALGSDIPFALVGGMMLGTGRGEQLSAVLASGISEGSFAEPGAKAKSGSFHWVLAVSETGLSTPAVYRKLDELRPDAHNAEPAAPPTSVLTALRTGDIAGVAAAVHNDLQAPAIALRPDLARTLAVGTELGALASFISGSGPTCVFLAATADDADRIAVQLSSEGVCHRVMRASGPARGAHLA